MFRLVYWEDLREHLVQSEAVVFPVKYRGETHLLGAYQRQSAATPTYTRELGSHNRYVWKVPITRHPKGWEVQCPKCSMSVQSAKGSDTESTLMICLTSKRWGPQQPKLSSHTCHTWYLWQREGPPFPPKTRHCCRFTNLTNCTDPWKRGSLVHKCGNFWWIPNKEGMILTNTTPSSIWVRKKQSQAEASWPVVVNKSHAVLCKMENYKHSQKVGILSFHHKKMVETVLQHPTPA